MMIAHKFTRWISHSPLHQAIFARQFSIQDAATALRPFFFMVHPDFFGHHPNERIVNENSLKMLNEYLASHESKQRKIKLNEISFYVRKGNSFSQELKLLTVRLEGKSLRETVLIILRTSGLSVAHVAEEAKSSNGSNRPIDWHPSYYEATGKKNPHVNRSEKPSILSLRSWLRDNIEKSKMKAEAVSFIKDDIQRLLDKIKHNLSLHSIRCDSVWGLHNFRGCLKSFDRLCNDQPEFMRDVLKDRVLVFGNTTGVSRSGEVILSGEDVSEYWYTLLMSVAAYDAVLLRLPKMEEKLSSLLNGICIVRKVKRHGKVMAEEYELMLNKLINMLRRCQDHVKDRFQDNDLSSLQLAVDGENSPMMLSSNGQFLVPASIPGTLVVDFIKKHQEEALSLCQHMEQLVIGEKDKRQKAIKLLELLELNKDESVTPSQMISCCTRLVEQGWMLGGSLAGCRVRISHYYSVMQDGEICLPWDWVGTDD